MLFAMVNMNLRCHRFPPKAFLCSATIPTDCFWVTAVGWVSRPD